MNELTKIKQRILARIDEGHINVVEGPRDENDKAFMRSYDAIEEATMEKIINEEFDRAFLELPNIEQIVKDTIKKYIDKDYDDVTELLLALNKDLCARIRKENENGL